MTKIIVIGCPGSGKSTFSRALQQATGLPLFHLDLLYWNADRTTVPRDMFLGRLQSVLEKDAWIIDGNYASTLELRLRACDTVIFLDYPTEVCLDGIRTRRGQKHSDLPWIEPADDEDKEFTAFVRNYNTHSRPQVLELLKRYPDKSIFIFKSRDEADEYLKKIR